MHVFFASAKVKRVWEVGLPERLNFGDYFWTNAKWASRLSKRTRHDRAVAAGGREGRPGQRDFSAKRRGPPKAGFGFPIGGFGFSIGGFENSIGGFENSIGGVVRAKGGVVRTRGVFLYIYRRICGKKRYSYKGTGVFFCHSSHLALSLLRQDRLRLGHGK